MAKLKTYVLIVSCEFPAYHYKAGKPTGFKEKILSGDKIHTIRDNYELWKKRIDEVLAGKAILSLRQWTASPYNYKRDGSKQVEFLQLDKNSGIGIQKLGFSSGNIHYPYIDTDKVSSFGPQHLAQNDSLSFNQFLAWFKPYDLSTHKAIIHFTNFRY